MTEFSVGNVISRSFSVWWKNIVPFTVLMSIIYTPLIIAMAMRGGFSVESLSEDRLLSFLDNLLSMIASAAMVYGVFQQLRGQHASLGECVSVGLSRLLPVIGVGIVVGICVVLGTIALIIPGIIIYTMLYVAVPVAVVERPGVFASLSRSKALTHGHKLSIFGIVVILAVIQIGVAALLGVLLDGVAAGLAVLVLSILMSTLTAVTCAVVYHDLRTVKDGVGIDELVRVFE